MPSITTCTVTGNVANLLNAAVANCTIKVSVIAPFFHPTSGTWISGELESVVTDATGAFSVALIETATPGVKLAFTFEYYDGVANRRTKQYSVIVPNQASALLSDLVAATYTSTAVPTFPASQVTVSAVPGLTATNAQAAIAELKADISSVGTPITALTGDVTATGPGSAAASVVSVGGSSAANVHSAEQAANAATNLNTVSTIVKRDASGNFSAGTITAALSGNASTATTATSATSATSFTGSLAGDVTGTQSATTVGKINGVSLAGLSTGILKNTTTTGAPSIAVAADFPTLNQNTTGTAANITATSNSTLTTLSALTLPGSQVSGNITGSAANVTGTVATNHGGTGVTSVTTAPTASAFAGWDASSNLSANNLIEGYATTVTAAGTTTLTVASAGVQNFTGTTTQNAKLPVASTLTAGHTFIIQNQSTGAVTVQTSGLNTLATVGANQTATVTCVNAAGGTGTASWTYSLAAQSVGGSGTVTSVGISVAAGGMGVSGSPVTGSGSITLTPKVPTKQVFTSSSGTYTVPSSPAPLYLCVHMVGGGGGGGGSGTAGGSSAGGGGTTTFGTSLLTATGGGAGSLGSGGAGGSGTVTTSATVLQLAALSGANGSNGIGGTAASFFYGGMGGSSAFGGAGAQASVGGAAQANTGSGGAGGQANSSMASGGGGGAGGYVKALINSPTGGATFSYAVGGGGSASAAGTGGNAGGAGAAGIIIVEEFYQ